MHSDLFLLALLPLIAPSVASINLNTGFTDALTLEEYEDDVELIKLNFDFSRPCRFFSDQRRPKVEKGLANCSWYEENACCRRTEVASVFESMYTLYKGSQLCQNMMNYLMCFFCAPDQYLWYIRKRVKICRSFCEDLYASCKGAEFNGKIIDINYKSGIHFCVANNFNVVTTDCFAFDGNAFSTTSQLFQPIVIPIVLSLVLMSVFFVVDFV